MPERKKSALAILIICACAVFFLSRKYFWASQAIQKKGQEGANALLSNEETTLLLTKIENLLGESTGKKTASEDAETTFRSRMYADAGEVLPSANQGFRANQEIRDNGISVSSGKENLAYKTSLSDTYQESRKQSLSDDSVQKQTRAEEPPQKAEITDVLRTGTFVPATRQEVPGSQVESGSHQKEKDDPPGPPPDTSPPPQPSGPYAPPGSKIPKQKSQDQRGTPWSIEFFGSVNAKEGSTMVSVKEGSTVWACDSEGKVCSSKAVVKKNGMYGVLHIYLDDPGTQEKDGMRLGEQITFWVNGKIAIPRGPAPAVCQGGSSDLKQVNLEVDS